MTVTAIADLEAHVAAMPPLRVDFAEIAPEQPSLQRPPRFVLGAVPDGLVLPMLGELVTGPIRLHLARDLRIGPDGLLLDGSVALSSPLLNMPPYHAETLVRALNDGPPRTIRRLNQRAVWLCGPGSRIYGHWLVDFLPRLLLLDMCGHPIDTLTYVVASPIAGFVRPLLAAFGIGEHQITTFDEATELLEVEELLIPTNLRRGGRLHRLMKDARDLLVRRATAVSAIAPGSAHAGRVFISRTGADPSRTLANRAMIERIAAEAGLTILRPETMSVGQQIATFQGVSQAFGEYGSGLHNMMFAGPGAITCALRGSSIHPGFIQSALADVFDQSIAYVLAPTPLDAVEQVPDIDENSFRIALQCASLAASGA